MFAYLYFNKLHIIKARRDQPNWINHRKTHNEEPFALLTAFRIFRNWLTFDSVVLGWAFKTISFKNFAVTSLITCRKQFCAGNTLQTLTTLFFCFLFFFNLPVTVFILAAAHAERIRQESALHVAQPNGPELIFNLFFISLFFFWRRTCAAPAARDKKWRPGQEKTTVNTRMMAYLVDQVINGHSRHSHKWRLSSLSWQLHGSLCQENWFPFPLPDLISMTLNSWENLMKYHNKLHNLTIYSILSNCSTAGLAFACIKEY